MIDVAKHQAKQNEIDRRMAETISSFMAKQEYCTNPMAALEACREAAREATAQSTPVKEMEAFTEKVAARILARNRAKSDVNAKPDSQTSQRSEETAVENIPTKGVHHEGKSSLISRLEAVEAVVATIPTPQVAPNLLVTGMQMPMHMGWMSPYHALITVRASYLRRRSPYRTLYLAGLSNRSSA